MKKHMSGPKGNQRVFINSIWKQEKKLFFVRKKKIQDHLIVFMEW